MKTKIDGSGRVKYLQEARRVAEELRAGSMSISELSETIGVPWVRIYRTLLAMKAAGWKVSRERAGADGRAVRWKLNKGRRHAESGT